jgi:hypothetical protein
MEASYRKGDGVRILLRRIEGIYRQETAAGTGGGALKGCPGQQTAIGTGGG